MTTPIRWLASTIGKRNYIAEYLRAASPAGSVIIGTGNQRYTPGFMSCDIAHVVPAITAPDYPDHVLALCRAEGVTAAITLSDLDVGVLPTIRDALAAAGVACWFPDMATAQRFLDKAETARFLEEIGLATPRSFTDLDAAEAAIGYPMVIKPRRGSASQGFGIFHDRPSAEAHWRAIELPMAQAVVRGRLVNVEACSDPEGRLLGLSIWERHSSVAGETLLAETIAHEGAQRTARALLAASPIPGPVDMDLVDVDGTVYVLEVNTRFGGGYPASHLAGAAFPEAMVGAMLGAPPPPVERYRPGVKMMKKLTPIAFDEARVREAAKP